MTAGCEPASRNGGLRPRSLCREQWPISPGSCTLVELDLVEAFYQRGTRWQFDDVLFLLGLVLVVDVVFQQIGVWMLGNRRPENVLREADAQPLSSLSTTAPSSAAVFEKTQAGVAFAFEIGTVRRS